MAFLVCLLFRESIGVAITKSFVIFVRKFFVSSIYSSCRHVLTFLHVSLLKQFIRFCPNKCSIAYVHVY